MTRIGNGGEQDLVRDIQRGDRVAMKLLYCRYAGCLTAVCVTILFSALTRMFPKPTFAP